MDYVLGCDIGSQGVKALLLELDGKVAAEASAGYGIDYPQPTWADQPTERWLTALNETIPAVCQQVEAKPGQIKAVGLDTASIDHGQSTLFETHRALFARNVPALENLANLEQLPATGFTLIALPMKIAGGSGGPLRAIAIVPGKPLE